MKLFPLLHLSSLIIFIFLSHMDESYPIIDLLNVFLIVYNFYISFYYRNFYFLYLNFIYHARYIK